MPDQATLRTQPRSVTGSAVKRLRRDGVLPCNVYGRGIDSIAIQTPLAELRRVFRSVDRNAVVQMAIDGRDGTVPVVLREVQRHPVSGELLHVDFYQGGPDSRDSQRGAPRAGRRPRSGGAGGGTLVQSVEYILLEALPLEMPSELEVDISGLAEFGSSVLVRDLALPEGVRVLADEAVGIATVLAPRLAAEDEEEEAEAAAEAAEEAAPTAETPTDAEAPTPRPRARPRHVLLPARIPAQARNPAPLSVIPAPPSPSFLRRQEPAAAPAHQAPTHAPTNSPKKIHPSPLLGGRLGGGCDAPSIYQRPSGRPSLLHSVIPAPFPSFLRRQEPRALSVIPAPLPSFLRAGTRR